MSAPWRAWTPAQANCTGFATYLYGPKNCCAYKITRCGDSLSYQCNALICSVAIFACRRITAVKVANSERCLEPFGENGLETCYTQAIAYFAPTSEICARKLHARYLVNEEPFLYAAQATIALKQQCTAARTEARPATRGTAVATCCARAAPGL